MLLSINCRREHQSLARRGEHDRRAPSYVLSGAPAPSNGIRCQKSCSNHYRNALSKRLVYRWRCCVLLVLHQLLQMLTVQQLATADNPVPKPQVNRFTVAVRRYLY